MDDLQWATLSADLSRAPHDSGADRAAAVDQEDILWVALDGMQLAIDEPCADLYLLALLRHLDGDAWRSRVKQLSQRADNGSTRREQERIERRVRGPLPRLGVSVTIAKGLIVATKKWTTVTDRVLLVNPIPQRKAATYIAIEKELLSVAVMKDVDVSSMDLRTPVRIHCDVSHANLQQIAKLANAQATRTLETTKDDHAQRFQRHAPFRLHELCANRSSLMGWSGVLDMKRIVESGVRIRTFPSLNVMDRDIVVKDAMEALQVLFPAAPSSSNGVECARVSDYTPPMLVPALLSAVRACPSVRTLSLGPLWRHKNEKHRQFWPWLAYMLRGRGARHQIDTVKLEGTIGTMDIVVMREILHVANPLAVLYGGDTSSKPSGRIEARCFQLLDPTAQSTQASAWTYPTPVEVDVVTSGGVWWSVLLPGYGQAWVHQDSIILHTAYDDLPVVQGVREFEHVCDRGGFHELELAVEMWGPSLTTLSSNFETGRNVIELDKIERILAACLSLRRLLVPGAALATRCLRTIISMSLHTLEASFIPSGDASDLVRFFTILADENHACTIALESLWLRIVVQQEEDLEFLQALATTLAENRTLTTVTLRIEDSGYNGHQRDAIVTTLMGSTSWERHREVFAPVRRKCRLAFLSAMNHQPSDSAMSRLDSSVLAVIFDFAVHRFTRSVELQYMLR